MKTIISILTVIVVGLAGCMTTDQLAPPVGESMIELAASDGRSIESLKRGRLIYITKCASCHSPRSTIWQETCETGFRTPVEILQTVMTT